MWITAASQLHYTTLQAAGLTVIIIFAASMIYYFYQIYETVSLSQCSKVTK